MSEITGNQTAVYIVAMLCLTICFITMWLNKPWKNKKQVVGKEERSIDLG